MNMTQSKNSTAHLNSYLGGKPALLLAVCFFFFAPVIFECYFMFTRVIACMLMLILQQ